MTYSNLDISILSTLAYARVFSVGVPLALFHSWLHTQTKVSKKNLLARLTWFEQKKIIITNQGWVSIDSTVGKKERKRWQVSEQKIAYLQSRLHYFTWIPWVVGVGITGSVAAFNAREAEDIDVLLVTKAKRLWISRLLLASLLWGLGSLRTQQMTRVRNKLCLNVWIDETALQFSPETLYLGREIIQIQWLVSRDQIQSRLLRENRWVRQYFGNTIIPIINFQAKKALFPHISRIIDAIDFLASRLQKFHMRGHISREVVTRHKAMFHPRDTNASVLRAYEKIFKQYVRKYSKMIERKD